MSLVNKVDGFFLFSPKTFLPLFKLNDCNLVKLDISVQNNHFFTFYSNLESEAWQVLFLHHLKENKNSMDYFNSKICVVDSKLLQIASFSFTFSIFKY